MIKTLRITSIVAAVLAVIFLVFFVFPVVFRIHSSEHISGISAGLNSPGVIEKFNTTVGNKAKTSQNQVSPLVQQAGAFALYLNPPPDAKTPKAATGRTAGITSGPSVPPKFKVIGTSYYKDRPELSMALIDEPGKGLRWVRQSSEVGHFLIEQVKDGLVVFKDSKGTFEQKAEQKPEMSLLEGASGASSSRDAVSSQTGVSDRTSVSSRTRGQDSSKSTPDALGITDTGIAEAESEAIQMQKIAEEEAKMQLVERLREILRDSDKAGSGPSAKEKAAMMEKIISEFKSSQSSRLSDEETERLNILGKELKKVLEESESNPSPPEENKDN